MKFAHSKLALLLAAAVAAGGCSLIKKSAPKTPVLGERVAVLTVEGGVEIDPATAALAIALPPQEVNTEWAQSGGNAAKSMGHPALGASIGQAFEVSIGRGNSLSARLASSPVVAAGRVYTIDTTATVRAFDATTGAPVWATQFGTEKGNDASLYGGGVAFDNGRIYATNGLGFVAALDAGNGGLVWQVRPGGPLRGAPTVAGDALYVMSQDNQIFSLKTADGKTDWTAAAALEIAGVFGSAAPAFAQGTVVAGFSSGELNAYRYENGRLVWQDQLARTSITTSVSSLSDIDADPVIDGGQVIAVGQGGRMVALELTRGQRLWEINIAGISTPWVVGEWAFVVTDDAKLIAVSRVNGKVSWINQLPRYSNEKKKAGPISYVGPILAGDRLIVAGSNGVIINVNPLNGSFQSQTKVDQRVSLSPVVANSTLYILDDGGKLHAFR
ncbi:PQQ-binding-like beta-propeller repeat protein [Sphingomonas sp.]|uniref:PQQ-like beta-propeller repeat protein n=1 Tax=Sphingomonas sp. TaxID=28214 RepID=UPI00286D9EF9|nr:PQQ-binding-like beta-propeller repeat protein [Sphingomonas sp.]